MVLELRQTTKLSQGLVMTPNLQLGIKLLAMNRLELEAAIQAELVENPVLDEIADDFGNPYERSTENYGSSAFSDDEKPTIEQSYSRKPTLIEHLRWQIETYGLSELEQQIAIRLIGEMDEAGFFDCKQSGFEQVIEEISRELDVPTSWVDAVRHHVMMMDPVGCLAKDVQECLLAQLKSQGLSEGLPFLLVQNYWIQTEHKDIRSLLRSISVPEEELREALEVIRGLEPMPGRAFRDSQDHIGSHYVVPDVFVLRVGDELSVIANDDGLPRLQISPFYLKKLSQLPKGEEAKFIREKLRSGTFLMRSLLLRQRTICRVAEAIVANQRDWFLGQGPLRPLVLKQVADQIGVHESTVSRVTAGKYLQCQKGVVELKHFFGSAIARTDGDAIANASVKEAIQQLLAKENPKKPFSDMDIVERLKKVDIEIARRTVAKYRESLGILPSSKRRRSL